MDDVIKLVSSNEFGSKREKQIMECIRAFKIDHRQIGLIKKVFIDCDLDDDGNTTVGQLNQKLKDLQVNFPITIYNFFINILLEDDVFEVNGPKSFT